MGLKLFVYAFLVWFIFVIAAILNGLFRNSFITPRVGEHAGHVISTVIFIIVILVGTYIFINNLKIDFSTTDLLLIGVFWLVLTVSFEFIFGHYIAGHPRSKLLADYNILKGRVWIFVLLTNLFAPFLIGSILKK